MDSRDVAAAASDLAAIYGPNPQEVGPEGREDDFGDLISEALERLGQPEEGLGQERWEAVQEAAAGSEATSMAGFLHDLLAAL